jgi:hypothetical protein
LVGLKRLVTRRDNLQFALSDCSRLLLSQNAGSLLRDAMRLKLDGCRGLCADALFPFGGANMFGSVAFAGTLLTCAGLCPRTF